MVRGSRLSAARPQLVATRFDSDDERHEPAAEGLVLPSVLQGRLRPGGLPPMIAIAILAVALALPNPTLTPGATRPVTLNELCTPGTAAKVRHVTAATKRDVFRRYQLIPRKGAYEIDHLISLELGG